MHTICPRSLVNFIFLVAILNKIDKTLWTYSIILNIRWLHGKQQQKHDKHNNTIKITITINIKDIN